MNKGNIWKKWCIEEIPKKLVDDIAAYLDIDPLIAKDPEPIAPKSIGNI